MAEEKPKWFDEKVYGRLSNIEFPGSPMDIRVNGVKTRYEDGFTGYIPKAYVEAIGYCVAVEHKNRGVGLPPISLPRPRFLFNEMVEPGKTEEDEKIVESIVEEKLKKPKTVRVSNDVPGDVQPDAV
jgi:hypothetical protein